MFAIRFHFAPCIFSVGVLTQKLAVLAEVEVFFASQECVHRDSCLLAFSFIILQVFILQNLPYFKFYGFTTHVNIIKMPWIQIEQESDNKNK